MEICSFWCGSLSPQLPDSACFSVSAACFSLAGHMIRRSGQFLSSNPYPGVHPRRSPVDLYSLERFQAASIHSLCQRTPFTLFLSDCTVPARAERASWARPNVSSGTCPPKSYPPQSPPCRRGSAMPSTVGSGAPDVPCCAVLCHAVRLGGSCGPRQLAVRGCPVQFARLIAQKCSEATSVDEGKLGSSIVFILAPPRCVSSLILAVV